MGTWEYGQAVVSQTNAVDLSYATEEKPQMALLVNGRTWVDRTVDTIAGIVLGIVATIGGDDALKTEC